MYPLFARIVAIAVISVVLVVIYSKTFVVSRPVVAVGARGRRREKVDFLSRIALAGNKQKIK